MSVTTAKKSIKEYRTDVCVALYCFNVTTLSFTCNTEFAVRGIVQHIADSVNDIFKPIYKCLHVPLYLTAGAIS